MTIQEAKIVLNRSGYKVLKESESENEVDKAIDFVVNHECNEDNRYKYLDPLFKKIQDLSTALTTPAAWQDDTLDASRVYLKQVLSSLTKIYNIRDSDRYAYDPDYVDETPISDF
jgi:hypothetical protein